MALNGPSKTIQLTATAMNAAGDSLATTGQVNFRAVDSTVTVTASGLVTAQYVTPAGGTQVIAVRQENNVTHTDTAFIRVTASALAFPLATFSIQPITGDSAVGFARTTYVPVVTAQDSMGNVVAFSTTTGNDNFYWLTTNRPHIAVCSACNGYGEFNLSDTGHVTFYAESWVYGVTVKDSLKYFVTWETATYLEIVDIPDEQDIEEEITGNTVTSSFISVGGSVNWHMGSITYWPAGQYSVVFDDSTQVDSALDLQGSYTGRGNIHFGQKDIVHYIQTMQARSFPVAGVYHYHVEGMRYLPSGNSISNVIYVLPAPAR